MRIFIHSESFFWIPVWITSPIHSAPFKKKGNFYPPLLLFLSLSLWSKHTSCTKTMSRGDFVDKSHLIYNHSSWEFFLLHFFVWWWMAEILPPFITLVSVSICTTISHNSCDYFDPTEPMFWYICLVSSADGSLKQELRTMNVLLIFFMYSKVKTDKWVNEQHFSIQSSNQMHKFYQYIYKPTEQFHKMASSEWLQINFHQFAKVNATDM